MCHNCFRQAGLSFILGREIFRRESENRLERVALWGGRIGLSTGAPLLGEGQNGGVVSVLVERLVKESDHDQQEKQRTIIVERTFLFDLASLK